MFVPLQLGLQNKLPLIVTEKLLFQVVQCHVFTMHQWMCDPFLIARFLVTYTVKETEYALPLLALLDLSAAFDTRCLSTTRRN